MSTFRANFATSAGSGIYAMVIDNVRKSKSLMILDSCIAYHSNVEVQSTFPI